MFLSVRFPSFLPSPVFIPSFRSSAAWLSLVSSSSPSSILGPYVSFSVDVRQLAVSAFTTFFLLDFSEVTSQSFFFFSTP